MGTRPKPANFSERKKDRHRPPDAKEKRPKRPKPAAPAMAAEPPPEQYVDPSGLSRFYHTHRWGVPLPLGPVAEDANSDDELDESWRLSETEVRLVRIRGRGRGRGRGMGRGRGSWRLSETEERLGRVRVGVGVGVRVSETKECLGPRR